MCCSQRCSMQHNIKATSSTGSSSFKAELNCRVVAKSHCESPGNVASFLRLLYIYLTLHPHMIQPSFSSLLSCESSSSLSFFPCALAMRTTEYIYIYIISIQNTLASRPPRPLSSSRRPRQARQNAIYIFVFCTSSTTRPVSKPGRGNNNISPLPRI